MPRYLFKILIISLLDDPHDSANLFDEACTIAGTQLDETISIPGVSIRNLESTLSNDTMVNAELWFVNEPGNVEYEEIIKGSDGVVLCVDPSRDIGGESTNEYLGILEHATKFLPASVIVTSCDEAVTSYDTRFARAIWERHVVEVTTLSRSNLGQFKGILETLFRGSIDHPDAGPIAIDQAWLRSAAIWKIATAKVEGDVSKQDMAFLGRLFYVLASIARARGKNEYYATGAIASRWFEMASEYLPAIRVAEKMGDKGRVRFLKEKYLKFAIRETERLAGAMKFKEAAQKFEELGFWNRTEAVDRSLDDELFVKAIDCWASAIEFERVGDLLRQVRSPSEVLTTLKDKIHRGIDFLVKQDLLDKANAQLGIITNLFLRHDLPGSAGELAAVHGSVKLDLLKQKIEAKFIGDSVFLLEELDDLNTRMDLELEIPDELVVPVCHLLIDEQKFHDFETMIHLVKDEISAKELTARRVVKEEEIEAEAKARQEKIRTSLYERLLAYHAEEKEDAVLYADARRRNMYEMIDQGNADRALYFLKIAAEWLKDIDQTEIAGDLAYKVAEFMLRNGVLLSLRDLEEFIPLSRLEGLVNAVLKQVANTLEDLSDLNYSAFIEYYQKQARSNQLNAQADELAHDLVRCLVREAILISISLTAETVDLLLAKMDKLRLVVSATGFQYELTKELDEINEKLCEYYIREKELREAEQVAGQVSSLEKKKVLFAQITRLQDSLQQAIPDENKQREEARVLREDIIDTQRILVLKQHVLKADRAERLVTLERFRDEGKLDGSLPCFVSAQDLAQFDPSTVIQAEEAALPLFFKERNYGEAALAIAVIALLAWNAGDDDALANLIASIETDPDVMKQVVMDQPPFKLVQDAAKASERGLTEDHDKAIENLGLLPLLNAERELVGQLVGTPSAGEEEAEGAEPSADAVLEELEEVLPELIEAISLEFGSIKEALLMKRQLLRKNGGILGITMIKQKNPEKASFYYQDDAFKLFDEGEQIIGWVSIWCAELAMIKARMNPKEIDTLLNSVIKASAGREAAECSLAPVAKLLLKVSERRDAAQLANFSQVNDLLPLFDEERSYFNLKSLV
jgi:hypothetical protein